VATQVAASQEGLSSMELVKSNPIVINVSPKERTTRCSKSQQCRDLPDDGRACPKHVGRTVRASECEVTVWTDPKVKRNLRKCERNVAMNCTANRFCDVL
jgi:hypothetical protein